MNIVEEKQGYACLKDDGTIEFVPIAKYAAAVLRTIDNNGRNTKVEPTLNEEAVGYHFKELKTSVQEIEQEASGIEAIQKDVLEWFRIENPVSKMVNDLIDREASKATVNTYRSVGNSFMRKFDYEPNFTHDEVRQFLNMYKDNPSGTRRVYRDILKLLWEVQGMVFPLKERRMHTPHSIMPIIPPMFSAKAIANIIKAVKFRGTPEEKYYLCMATVYAPRRIELAEITAKNFIWNGNSGTLIFNPHKHGLTRQHHIPEKLVPYIKEYSYKVKSMTDANLTRKFWLFANHLDLPVPKLSKAEKQALREKHQRPRQYGWHAFRHALTTTLLENGISDTMVNRWLGWRSGSQASPMVSTYYMPQDLDNKVQQKHPFIKLWKSL